MSSRTAPRSRRWQRLFIAVSILVLAQVIWWTSLFLHDVETIASLKLQNAQLSSSNGLALAEQINQIVREAFHRRLMFSSEAVFFLTLSCLGMYLLLRALRAEEKAMETQRNFVEIVSHESRTPLTALKLRLESIVEKRQVDVELNRELGLAREEVKRLSALFEKVLSLNRLERDAFQFELVYLDQAAREVLHRLEPLFREKKVKVDTQLDSEVPLKGDFQGLQNLMQSLLENAVFYNNADEKRLRIQLKKQPGIVTLLIQDNGPGISDSDRPHIFERFYRGSVSGKVPGSGLGLYLALRVTEAHGGSIQYVSASPGSRFEVTFPTVVEKT